MFDRSRHLAFEAPSFITAVRPRHPQHGTKHDVGGWTLSSACALHCIKGDTASVWLSKHKHY